VKCYIDNSVRLQSCISGANLVMNGTAPGLGRLVPAASEHIPIVVWRR
jgi:hypothetical protein